MRWTDKQREIVDLIQQGKTFNEITAMGYSNNMVSRVNRAIKRGELPEEKSTEKSTAPTSGQQQKKGSKSLIAAVELKGAPLLLDLGQAVEPLDRGDIYDAYHLYSDLRARGILNDNFSSVIRDGVGIIWRLLITKPLIEGEEVKLSEVTHGGSTGQSEEGPGV
jgi:hypothetical protein